MKPGYEKLTRTQAEIHKKLLRYLYKVFLSPVRSKAENCRGQKQRLKAVPKVTRLKSTEGA